MRLIENQLARIEQFLNPIDRIPFIGAGSGFLRLLAGAVQTLVGPLFAVLKILSLICIPSRSGCCDAIEQGFLYSLHGVGNMLRGTIAIQPFFNWLFLSLYDKRIGRMNYSDEILRPRVYPLMTAHKLVQYS